jgi:hypothetical protein
MSQGMTRILSFDVGMRHLAFCRLSVPPAGGSLKSCEIEAWDMIDLGTDIRGVESCARLLTRALNERIIRPIIEETPKISIDCVLIERQPKHRSIMMVAIQMFLCEYFTALSLPVIVGDQNLVPKDQNLVPKDQRLVGKVVFISAKEKLKICPFSSSAAAVPRRLQYAQNKKQAISTTRRLLEDHMCDYGNLVIFDMHKKKDDLADAFLQAIAYSRVVVPVTHQVASSPMSLIV